MAQDEPTEFTAAEIGAVAHLYRAEVYRSTTWRTRLDTTTNWSVVTLGVAMSISYSSPEASALPLVLVGVLIMLFVALEARRYRYFNVWRARTRWMEKHFYEPLLRGKPGSPIWREVLAEDYVHPRYHVTWLTALGRRIRRNYYWILLIQSLAYLGKLTVHPMAADDLSDILDRAGIGPVPGWAVLLAGLVYIGSWLGLTLWVGWSDARRHLSRSGPDDAMG